MRDQEFSIDPNFDLNGPALLYNVSYKEVIEYCPEKG